MFSYVLLLKCQGFMYVMVFICQGFEVYRVLLSEVLCVLGLKCLGFDVSGV